MEIENLSHPYQFCIAASLAVKLPTTVRARIGETI